MLMGPVLKGQLAGKSGSTCPAVGMSGAWAACWRCWLFAILSLMATQAWARSEQVDVQAFVAEAAAERLDQPFRHRLPVHRRRNAYRDRREANRQTITA